MRLKNISLNWFYKLMWILMDSRMHLKKSVNFGINLIEPLPYQEINTRFEIFGWVTKRWLVHNKVINDRLSLDFLDIDGQIFIGSTAHVFLDKSKDKYFQKWFAFREEITFGYFNKPFIKESQGCIAILLKGYGKKHQLICPIVIKSSDPNFRPSREIVEKHKKLSNTINNLQRDADIYLKKIQKITERRLKKLKKNTNDEGEGLAIDDWEINQGINEILEEHKDGYNLFQSEDLEEQKLEERYKAAIEWLGPSLGGEFGRINGFVCKLFSDDHDTHFHIVHRGRGINARFSFPELELINYKNAGNTINKREKDCIVEFLKTPEIFSKLEEELRKRDDNLVSVV